MGAFPQQTEMVQATIENTASAVTWRETGVKSARSVKVDRRSLDWRAADVLREQILSGKLVPGQRITETALAAQLEVSRGTLRAALRALAHEGLIQQVAYTKWMLPEFSNSDAWELYTLRGTLEGMAARLAAQHRTPACVLALEAAFERLVAAVKSKRHARVADADLALHKTIVEITGHQRLIDQYHLLEQQVRHYIVCSNALIMDLNQIVSEHEPIVQAIIVGNAEAAETLARDHNAPEVERAAAAMAQEQAGHAVEPPPAKQKGRSPARQSKAA
ncbi:MAG: GntR family transcriptional regulator [Rhodospirillum sp.]|nr:GntR family transcriptional regulator [Rhodospirillum sp.]